jgi:ABC-type bacteriocin/lantibiotic exporter with double-glycine peptidase domain
MSGKLLRRRRIVRVRQHDSTDCGAACLFSIGSHYGHRVPLARIREHAGTNGAGSTILGLIEAAERLGFAAKGVKGVYESLAAVPKPAVAHLDLGGALQHYVVLYRVTRRGVTVMDPADGRVHRLSASEFRARWTGILLLLVPAPGFRAVREARGAAARLWSLVRPHRSILAQSFLGAALHTLLGLSTAVYVQKIVDHALPDGNLNLLNLLGMAMLAVLAAQTAIGWVRDRITLITGQKIDAALLLSYHHHLLSLPQRFFDTRRVGELTSRMGDAVKVRAFINDVALSLTISVLVLVMSAAVMLTYSLRLALVVLAAVPLYAAIYLVNDRINRRTQRDLMEAAAEVEAELVEGLQSIPIIRAFGKQRWAMHRVERRIVRLLRPVYLSGITAIGARSASEAVTRLVTIVLLWVGGGMVIGGSLTTGELMSFYALVGYLTGPVGAVIGANRTARDALIAADRLFEIMDLEREEEPGRPALPRRIEGDVRFENVVFRYGTRQPVLQDLTLLMRAGAVTALVGESGSGKTTIASVLHRVYPLAAGRVMIGGCDIRYFSAESVRARVGLVPQSVGLVSASVAENVALGEFEPDMDRVVAVCDLLGVTAFVERLPEGFRTPLGEHGVSLSGGERQRIGVARALYRDPPILVLDEATASLDPVAEAYVRAAIDLLRTRGRTIVVISHRLGSIRDADSILVLREGRLAEHGTHRELLRLGGSYRTLWDRQHAPEQREQHEQQEATSRPQEPGADRRVHPTAGGAALADAEPPGWLRSIL